MQSRKPLLLLLAGVVILSGCRGDVKTPETEPVTSLRVVPAVRLNYRYEADVPAPDDPKRSNTDERNAGVQADFDQNRPQELLDRTILSPDGKRILAIYHKVPDVQAEFRLDMYSPDGKILRKITADTMAVHFPDTIRWSPDSSAVAFVAMTRGVSPETGDGQPDGSGIGQNANTNVKPSASAPADANGEAGTTDANTGTDANVQPQAPTPAPPTNVLTFRTEQIYLCNADGEGVKPITQNEGLIYFYYIWAPDSSTLAALAATAREWQYLQYRADQKGEIFVPVGRLRLVEKTGRERRLDDGLTAVQPVWSPDSAKVACAFDTQVRIYDANGNNPTQAAIPLRNNLLLSSKAFDDEQQTKLSAGNDNAAANVPATPSANSNTGPTTLPDEKSLVSFNPIVTLSWPADEQIYFETAYVKRMKNEADSVTSFPRWHRLILTPQPNALAR